MPKPTAIWGLDMGQCALKALKLELVDGKATATAFDYIEHPKIMSQPDADPEALAREALEKFLSRNPIGSDLVAVSVAGQSGGLARFVKLPPVEESKIADIVKFEAKQQIPFPLEEVVWDFQKIAGGEVVNNFAMETEIGLFAMKREIIARNLGQYANAGIECHIVQMAPLALTNYATYELLKKGGDQDIPMDQAAEPEADDTPRGKKKCIVVLDVGTDNSNLIITDAGKIIWQRPLSLGGNHFTRALSKEMKLTFAKAEHLKRNAAKSPDLAQILKSLRPVLTDFVGEVQRSLGYFTNTHRDAHVASMVGLGSAFKLPGLQKYMAEKLSLKVDRPSKITRLAGEQVLTDPVFSENILTFPIAYGLALQGLNTLSGRTDFGRINTNLLPSEIRTERIIRAKKPFAAAAAAALLLGTGLAAVGFGVQYSAATDANIKKAMEQAKQSKSQADTQTSNAKAGEEAVQKAEGEVKAIVAGADRRLDWVRLHQLVSIALPRAGASPQPGAPEENLPGVPVNLQDPNQAPLWRTDEGKRALDAYKDRVKRGLSVDRANDPDMTEYLAQVNVQEVRTRYTDNLKTFLDAADAKVWAESAKAIAENMPDGEREKDDIADKAWKPKAPEGGGWVVEIRGWTFHNAGSKFLVDAVVKNFQEDARKTDQIGPRKVDEFLAGVADPLKGRVSHVFLALQKKQELGATGAQANVLDLIGPNRNYLERYLSPVADPNAPPGSAPPGSPPGMPMSSGDGGMSSGGATGTGAGQWQPLNKQGTAAAGGSGPGLVIGIGPPGSSSGAFGYDDGLSSSGPPGSSPPGTAAVPPPKRVKQRTVFVLMFLWRDTPAAPPGADSANAPK